jgi:hypothetical protein
MAGEGDGQPSEDGQPRALEYERGRRRTVPREARGLCSDRQRTGRRHEPGGQPTGRQQYGGGVDPDRRQARQEKDVDADRAGDARQDEREEGAALGAPDTVERAGARRRLRAAGRPAGRARSPPHALGVDGVSYHTRPPPEHDPGMTPAPARAAPAELRCVAAPP